MCQEKEALLKSFSDAGNTLLVHLRLQTDAIVSGDPDFARFDCVIEEAKVQKLEVSQAYDAHVSNHACGCPLHRTLEFIHKSFTKAPWTSPLPEGFTGLETIRTQKREGLWL
jgi:hypothetical protein